MCLFVTEISQKFYEIKVKILNRDIFGFPFSFFYRCNNEWKKEKQVIQSLIQRIR